MNNARSTVAAVLLTILFWFMVWGLDSGQMVLLAAENTARRNAEAADLELLPEAIFFQFAGEVRLRGAPGPQFGEAPPPKRALRFSA